MQRRALDPRQQPLAQRLQRQGLLLREIAGQIGVSFEAVCLGLYGDNVTRETEDELDAGVADLGLGDEFSADRHRPLPLATNADEARASDPVAVAEDSAAGADAVPVRDEGATPPSPQPDRPAEPSGEPPAQSPVEPDQTAIDAERLDLMARFHPAQRFRLVSDDGQTLHQSLHVLTRLPSFFWRGTAEQLSAVRRRRPQWASLKPVPVS